MDELENRVAEVRLELSNNYKKTLKKLSHLFQNEEEYNDHDYADNAESQSTVAEVKFYILYEV